LFRLGFRANPSIVKKLKSDVLFGGWQLTVSGEFRNRLVDLVRISCKLSITVDVATWSMSRLNTMIFKFDFYLLVLSAHDECLDSTDSSEDL